MGFTGAAGAAFTGVIVFVMGCIGFFAGAVDLGATIGFAAFAGNTDFLADADVGFFAGFAMAFVLLCFADAIDFFGAAFFVTSFAAFLESGFAAFLGSGFFAANFLATGFFAIVFLGADFFAAAFLAIGFLGAAFFVGGVFFLAVDAGAFLRVFTLAMTVSLLVEQGLNLGSA